jgi:hypothetical protein
MASRLGFGRADCQLYGSHAAPIGRQLGAQRRLEIGQQDVDLMLNLLYLDRGSDPWTHISGCNQRGLQRGRRVP